MSEDPTGVAIAFGVLLPIFAGVLIFFLVVCIKMKKRERFLCNCLQRCFGVEQKNDVGLEGRQQNNEHALPVQGRDSSDGSHSLDSRHSVEDRTSFPVDQPPLPNNHTYANVEQRLISSNEADQAAPGPDRSVSSRENNRQFALNPVRSVPVKRPVPQPTDANDPGRRKTMGHQRAKVHTLFPNSAVADAIGLVGGPGSPPDAGIYENYPSGKRGHSDTEVKVNHLQAYVLNRKNNPELFDREFKNLPGPDVGAITDAKIPDNMPKNRFQNICAYNHSRVKLDVIQGDPCSDYINATYIPNWKHEGRQYIASQGPRKDNFVDMWRLIWQEGVGRIVMLTRLIEESKNKCDMYWPEDINEEMRYGQISVVMTSVDEYADYTIRTFTIKKHGEEARKVMQFHFLSWLDKTKPDEGAYRLLSFRRKVRAFDLNGGQMLVHCSAGVGRTGTFIAIDSLLDQAADEGQVDILGYVTVLRQNRMYMVQTKDQFIFIHDAILEDLDCRPYTIPSSNFQDKYNSMLHRDLYKALSGEFEKFLSYQASVKLDERTTGRKEDNIHKNRNSKIIPGDWDRPYLRTRCPEGNDYINAVSVDSFVAKQHYIITQAPLPNTVVDFWRLVYDEECSAVVMLNDMDHSDQTCPVYWPEGEEQREDFGPLIVEPLPSKQGRSRDPSIFVRDFRVFARKSKPSRSKDGQMVRHFQLTSWPRESLLPPDMLTIVNLFKQLQGWLQKVPRGGETLPKVVIHCLDGASRSGLVATIFFVLDKLNTDQEVDIFLAARYITEPRPELISTLQQYSCIYETVAEYMASYGEYANLGRVSRLSTPR